MSIKTIIFFLEFITAITATITWNKYRFTGERNFVYFFWVVFVADMTGVVLNYLSINSFFVYNLLCIFYFTFLLSWYYKILENKKAVVIFSIIYLLSQIYTFYNQDFFEQNQTNGLIIGCVILLFCSLIYFYQVLQSDEILLIKHSLPFWLTIGNIVFFVGVLPILLLQEYIGASDFTYGIVLTIVNFITYSCYTIGFLWIKNK